MDSFVERHEQIVKKLSSFSMTRLWVNSAMWGLVMFVAGSLYLYARRGEFDLYIANKALAGASLTVIGLSLALSGLCYFWDFVDTKIIYRKYLGITGFVMALAHGTISLWLLPDHFVWPEYFLNYRVTFFAGLTALVILVGMTVISNRYAAHELGGLWWRRLLRWGGYSALLLVMVHFGLMKYQGWIRWFKTREPWLPPLSLWTMVLAVGAVALRMALWWVEKKKKERVKIEYEEKEVGFQPEKV
jgi:DMSO/TMAO reductase YedYZ heme-binding membrane subunit